MTGTPRFKVGDKIQQIRENGENATIVYTVECVLSTGDLAVSFDWKGCTAGIIYKVNFHRYKLVPKPPIVRYANMYKYEGLGYFFDNKEQAFREKSRAYAVSRRIIGTLKLCFDQDTSQLLSVELVNEDPA